MDGGLVGGLPVCIRHVGNGRHVGGPQPAWARPVAGLAEVPAGAVVATERELPQHLAPALGRPRLGPGTQHGAVPFALGTGMHE